MIKGGRAFADAISFLELAADSIDPARDEFACPFSFADLQQLRSGWRFPWDQTPETGDLRPVPRWLRSCVLPTIAPLGFTQAAAPKRFMASCSFRTVQRWVRQVCCPAASRISRVISSGWEISERWLAFTSMVLAPIRLAMKRFGTATWSGGLREGKGRDFWQNA